jgi:hypothetical protein
MLLPSDVVPKVIDSRVADKPAQRWDVLGSRLLPTCRVAKRQSGLPPGGGWLDRAARLPGYLCSYGLAQTSFQAPRPNCTRRLRC